ncbi:MAG TPA: hypothetical protein VLF62_01070 [Candidatus Saccharimonadales bacterium]|nr:hypothetical protein [Candidatus Saccharimonadales bacterium]
MSENPMQPNPEQPENRFTPPAAAPRPRDLGDIMVNGTINDIDTLPELTSDDFAALEAIANGADIRSEDAGRVHDIEAAHEEAIEEDTQRTLALERSNAQPEEPQPETGVAALTAAIIAAKAETAHHSTRQQAQAALRSAGGLGYISPAATITKDPFSNSFTIVNGMHVQLVRPRTIGKRYEVTDYRYDETKGTLRISIRGHSSLLRPTGTFAPEETPEASTGGQGQEPPQEQPAGISLPPAVAHVVGFDRVAPAGAHS